MDRGRCDEGEIGRGLKLQMMMIYSNKYWKTRHKN